MTSPNYGAEFEKDWGTCQRCGCRRPLTSLKGGECADWLLKDPAQLDGSPFILPLINRCAELAKARESKRTAKGRR